MRTYRQKIIKNKRQVTEEKINTKVCLCPGCPDRKETRAGELGKGSMNRWNSRSQALNFSSQVFPYSAHAGGEEPGTRVGTSPLHGTKRPPASAEPGVPGLVLTGVEPQRHLPQILLPRSSHQQRLLQIENAVNSELMSSNTESQSKVNSGQNISNSLTLCSKFQICKAGQTPLLRSVPKKCPGDKRGGRNSLQHQGRSQNALPSLNSYTISYQAPEIPFLKGPGLRSHHRSSESLLPKFHGEGETKEMCFPTADPRGVHPNLLPSPILPHSLQPNQEVCWPVFNNTTLFQRNSSSLLPS